MITQVSTQHYRKTVSVTWRGKEQGTRKIKGRHIELIQLLIYCKYKIYLIYKALPASTLFLYLTIECWFLIGCYRFCIMNNLQNYKQFK